MLLFYHRIGSCSYHCTSWFIEKSTNWSWYKLFIDHGTKLFFDHGTNCSLINIQTVHWSWYELFIDHGTICSLIIVQATLIAHSKSWIICHSEFLLIIQVELFVIVNVFDSSLVCTTFLNATRTLCISDCCSVSSIPDGVWYFIPWPLTYIRTLQDL